MPRRAWLDAPGTLHHVIWGHPLKGLSREKTPPYSKKTYFF